MDLWRTPYYWAPVMTWSRGSGVMWVVCRRWDKGTCRHHSKVTLLCSQFARVPSTCELEGILLQWESVTSSDSVSWHFRTLIFAHGAPRHFLHNCHAQSRGTFFPNTNSLYDINQDTHKTKLYHTNKTPLLLRVCASAKVPITLATGVTHRSLHCKRAYPQVSIKDENVRSEVQGTLVLTSAGVYATTPWPLNASCLVSPWLLFLSALDCSSWLVGLWLFVWSSLISSWVPDVAEFHMR